MSRAVLSATLLALGLALGACDDGDESAGGSMGESDVASMQGDDAAILDAAIPDAAAPDARVADAAVLPDADIPLIPLDYPIDPACATDLVPGAAVVFAEGFAQGTEGISQGPGAALYVSSARDDAVYRLDPEGTFTPFATVPSALGLAWHEAEQQLVVASIGESNMPGVSDGAVYLVDAAGQETRLAEGIDSPNFAVVLVDGSILISDDFDTIIWRVTLEGEVTPALTDVPSPNGMALSPDGSSLYVASTFSPAGELTRVALDPAGLPLDGPENRAVLAEAGAGVLLDGMAVDRYGQIYLAANLKGEIWRLPPDGMPPHVVVASGLRTPASLAFGPPDSGFDPCSLYVTELLGTHVWRVAVGTKAP